MYYKVAVIQNSKELLKYDCADWKNKINIINNQQAYNNFQFYDFCFYDENNIEELFVSQEMLNEFDCICFSMNSLINESRNYKICKDNKEKIENFLSNGKGMFISFSNKISRFEFLPDQFVYEQKKISKTKQVNIEFDYDNAIFSHIEINNDVKAKYIEKANKHTTVCGVYYSFILDNINYDTLIYDIVNKKKINLMVSLKNINNCRIIATTLPIDWQDQDEIFINAIKYCVEGKPTTKILVKTDETNRKKTNDLFNTNYLIRELNRHKIPFSVSKIVCVNDAQRYLKYGNNMIFDHNFVEKEIQTFCKNYSDDLYLNNVRIIYHKDDVSKNDNINNITSIIIHGTRPQINSLKKLYIMRFSNYISKIIDPNENEHFENYELYEILKFLRNNGEDKIIDNDYKEKLLDNRIKKIKSFASDGSYDHMFVASCILFSVFELIDLKVAKQKIKNVDGLKQYIIKKIDDVSVSEKSRALYFLYETFSYEPSIFYNYEKKLNCFNDEIINCLKSVKLEEYTSYLTSNFIRVASIYYNKTLKRDCKEQDFKGYTDYLNIVLEILRGYGKFRDDYSIICVSNVVTALINIIKTNEEISLDNINKCGFKTSALKELNFMLFHAVGYLQNKLNIENKIFNQVVAISALTQFYSLNHYPVDEIIEVLMEQNRESNQLILMSKIQDIYNNERLKGKEIAEKYENVKLDNIKLKKSNKIKIIFVIISLSLCLLATTLRLFVKLQNNVTDIINLVTLIASLIALIISIKAKKEDN